MTKVSKDPNFLAGHKQIGKKLIPPLMQIGNIVPTSFQDETLPDLIWLAAIFRNYGDKDSIKKLTDFLRSCTETLGDEKLPPLVFLSNFSGLNVDQKTALRVMVDERGFSAWIRPALQHQADLYRSYPLDFLFESGCIDKELNASIRLLKEDVASLLDRYSSFATKVQVTAVYSMLVTRKLFISKDIEVPNFDAVISAPESDGAKRAASFARATLNTTAGGLGERDLKNDWAAEFWRRAFELDGCL